MVAVGGTSVAVGSNVPEGDGTVAADGDSAAQPTSIKASNKRIVTTDKVNSGMAVIFFKDIVHSSFYHYEYAKQDVSPADKQDNKSVTQTQRMQKRNPLQAQPSR